MTEQSTLERLICVQKYALKASGNDRQLTQRKNDEHCCRHRSNPLGRRSWKSLHCEEIHQEAQGAWSVVESGGGLTQDHVRR